MAKQVADRTHRGLGRADVVAAALRVVDAEGPAALTMRRVARELGVAPMTVHWHVGDRTELADLVVAEVLRGVAPVAPEAGTWVERMTAVLVQVRAELRRHPHVVTLLAGPGRITPAVIATGANVLDVVRELGLDDARTVEIFRTVLWHALGSVFVDGFLRRQGFFEDETMTRDVVDDIVTSLGLGDAGLATELATLDADALFRFGCERLLEGIERDVARR